MLRRLLTDRLRPFRRLVVSVVVLQAASSVAGLLLPSINADIIDRGVARGDQGYIWRMGAVMMIVTLIQVVLSVGAVLLGSRVAMGFGRDTRRVLFRKVNEFSSREVNHFGPPSLITRITNDVQQVQMLVLMTCTLLLGAPFTAFGGMVLAANQDLDLAWIVMVSVPLVMVILFLIVSRMVPMFRSMQDRIDRLNEVMREQLTGIRVVRAFVREPNEIERFEVGSREVTERALRGGRLFGLMFPSVTFVVNVSSVAVVWFGAHLIADGRMRAGSLVAFLTYLVQILMAVMMATFMGALYPRASVSAERIMEVLDTESSVVPPLTPITPTSTSPSLEMRGVGFSYPKAEQPVLFDVNVSVKAGETLAVIGSTGSGKSTLVSLIPRLFDATTGSVLVDGIDVRDIEPQALWSRIGLVPQKPYLFSGTVASNLRFGRDDATEDEMWEALRIAQADDFVRAMPGGLEAPITQGGANVSGGQRQRLSIARALIKRPGIYVFDDSFSALDVLTDSRLRSALVPHTANAVMVIVAQRVSSIRHAQQILVLEDGRVVGHGTHEELLATCDTYEEIVSSQGSMSGLEGVGRGE